LLKNSIIDNIGGFGLLIESAIVTIADSMVLEGNTGIEAIGDSQVTIANTWIGAHATVAVHLGDTVQAILTGNSIYSHAVWGISVVGLAQVRLEDNEFLNNSRALDVGGEGPQVYLQGNQFKRNGTGIWILSGQAVIIDNQLEENWGTAIHLGGVNTQVTLVKNTISNNQGDGIQLGSILAEISDNKIIDNEGCGIRIFTAAVAGKDNEIHDNAEGDLRPSDYPWPEGFVKGA
jgi:hypothetical protein